MDFIERLFGVAPDGGNGTVELLYFIVAGLAVGASIFRRHLREMLAAPGSLESETSTSTTHGTRDEEIKRRIKIS